MYSETSSMLPNSLMTYPCDTSIISPLRLSREFFQRFVGIGKPDVVHIMQNGVVGL